MTLVRWVGLRVLSGVLAALLIVGGLVGLATGVERGDQGLGAAISAGLAVVPITLVWLAPLCCGVGAALAMARVMARGEDVGLAAAGLGPGRTGRAAAVIGLIFGLCAWWASDAVVPHSVPRSSQSTWVWLEDGAYRPADGVWVQMEGGRISRVTHESPPSPEVLDVARQLSQPRAATAEVLANADTPPARLERASRLARVLACGSLALLGWIPLARRGSTQVGLVLAAALSATAVDMVLQALAAQGHLSVWLGAWTVPLLLAAAAGISSRS